MYRNQKKVSESGPAVLLLVIFNAIVLQQGMVQNTGWYGLLWLSVPALLLALLSGRKQT